MRILHVLEPSDGGVAIYVRDLSRELIARGHKVDAVVSDRPEFPDELRALGMGVAEVPFRAEVGTVREDLRVLRGLVRLLRQRRWDIVHSHGNKGGVFGRPIASACGIPVVHSPHGFGYLTQRERPRRGIEARRALTLGIERLLAPCARRILCAAAYDRDNALRDGIATPARMVVIYNGVAPHPPVEPEPSLARTGGDGPLIGFLARLHEGKAPLEFIDAIELARQRGSHLRAAVVGNGPLDREVRARAATADVAVLPLGGDPFPALAAFDVYVLPSRWELFPLTVLEAMAASLPIVATDVGGIPEAVAEGETGILVPGGDTNRLAAAIERLAGDAALRERMGRAGYARWEANFQHSAMVDAVEAIYESTATP